MGSCINLQRSVAVKGLVVLLVQISFLLFFNANLMSHDHALVTQPLHHEIRDVARITSVVHSTHQPVGANWSHSPQRDPVSANETSEDRSEMGERSSYTPKRPYDVTASFQSASHSNEQQQWLTHRNPVNVSVSNSVPSSDANTSEDGLNRKQKYRGNSDNPNSRDNILGSESHQTEVLTSVQNTPASLKRLSMKNRKQEQDILPLQRPELSWKNQTYVNQKHDRILPTQKTPQSSKHLSNANQNGSHLPLQKALVRKSQPDARRNEFPAPQSESPLTSKHERRLDNSTPHDEDAKRRDFNSYLLKNKQKALLSPGCPDRGVGNRVPSLAFVKVHKSASTTVANVLARYALRHTVNVVLPRKAPGNIRFNYFQPKITPSNVFPVPSGQRYQVVFNHMIFHRNDLQALMPNDTVYFAIMRDPLDRFVSGFIYYGFAQFFINRFRLPNVKEAFTFLIRHPQIMSGYTKPELYNSLAGDTGLPPSQHKDVHVIQSHIQKLEKDLDLIMVVEYFDESLVMLKRRSCLSMQDIVYLVKNVRSTKEQAEVTLTQQEKELFEQFQIADVLMYRHFYKKFWDLVYAEGPDFFLEVRHFKEIQRTVRDFCSRVESVWDFEIIPRSAWNEEFVVTARECRLMEMSELDMQLYLIVRAVRLYKMSKEGNLDVK